MNPIEQRVLDAISADELLAAVDRLVSFASLGGTQAEVEVQEAAADLMRSGGLTVDQWEIDLPKLYEHPDCSWEIPRERALGVVGMLGNGNGPKLVFNGHTDVVPAGDLSRWNYDPWRATLDNGRVYGRGALDMKGGLCCAIIAARAIAAAGVELQGQVLVQSVVGEEEGGHGTLAAILRGHVGDAAIVAEPTELKIAPAQAGAHNFRLTVFGAAAHGCVREEGVSAIEKFYPLQQAIIELERARNERLRANDEAGLFRRYRTPFAICIGTVRGGEWASSESEQLVAEGRYGIAVGENPYEARRELEQAVAAAAAADPWLAAHPPRLEWWGGTFDPAATAVDHPIVQLSAEAFQVVSGKPAVYEGMTYGADMRLLRNVAGMPTLLFGPGDVRHAHRPDESVPLEDMLTAARAFALTTLRYVGYRA